MANRTTERDLAALVEAGIALASELDVEALLQRIADLARDVIGAKYSALGVLGAEGELVNFLHSGVDQETVRKIGDLPTGKGVLGVLIEDGKPLRLREISDHGRSYGFPEHHPVMHSFLGVPIMVRNRIFGRLYLTEKAGGAEFSKDDERLALMFASQAGVAIENARLYREVKDRSEELAHRLAELSSMESLGKLLISGEAAEATLRSIAEEAKALTGAARATIFLLDEDTGDLVVRVGVGDRIAGSLLGKRLPSGKSKAHSVLERMKAEAVQDLPSDPQVDQDTLELLGNPTTGAFAPLAVKGRKLGVLVIYDRSGGRPFSEGDVEILQMLSGLAAIALENERLYEALKDLTVLEERDRISKELHDGVIQAIYSVGLSLQGSLSLMKRDPSVAEARIDEAIARLDDVVRDVRSYIFELRPKLVEEKGLSEAVREMLKDFEVNTLAHTQLALDGEACESMDQEQQTHVIQIIREVLSNIARHAGASEVRIACRTLDGQIALEIEDDGVGFDRGSVKAGHGLRNIEERAARLGGAIEIRARKPKGTRHLLRIPVRSDGSGNG